MPALRSSRPLPALSCVVLLAVGCGGDKDRPNDEQTAADEQVETVPKPQPPPTDTAVDASADTGGEPVEDDWGDMPEVEETDGVETAGEFPAPPEPYAGPCRIRWSSGTQVRFEYAEDGTGGRIRIDRDGDRKSDICGRFRLNEGKTTKVWIDDDCDGKTDLEIEPEYAEKANLATARYVPKGTPDKGKAITLITMPSFGGIDPGYPLRAARKDIDFKVRKGLVRSAHVKEPHDGPPTKVSLRYDDAGRVIRLEEDLEADGTVDRRFDYRYDDVGNVTRVTFRLGSGDDVQKGAARLDYRCWTEDEP